MGELGRLGPWVGEQRYIYFRVELTCKVPLLGKVFKLVSSRSRQHFSGYWAYCHLTPWKCPLAPLFHELCTFLEADGQGPEETRLSPLLTWGSLSDLYPSSTSVGPLGWSMLFSNLASPYPLTKNLGRPSFPSANSQWLQIAPFSF